MLATLLLRTAIIATPWLAKLVTAEMRHPLDGQKPLLATTILSSMTGTTMDFCGESISICGKTDKAKVVHAPKKTVYITQQHEFETVIHLPPEYVTVTQISVTTEHPVHEGHCRNTTTIYDEATTTVTVDRNVTTTREYVPIKYTTTTEVKTVTAKALHQCFIRTKSSRGSDSVQPTDSKPSVPIVQRGSVSVESRNSSEAMDAGGENSGARSVSESASTDTAAEVSTEEDYPPPATDVDANAATVSTEEDYPPAATDGDTDEDTDTSTEGLRYY